MRINDYFDGGNIDVQSAESPSDIRLNIRFDEGGRHGQWFYFQLCDARGEACTITIENAGDTSYPKGFEDYGVATSTDLEHWIRVETDFDGQALSWRYTPETDSVYFAYFAPYPFDRHQRLIGWALTSPGVSAEVLCTTPDGHTLNLLTLGEPAADKKSCWIIARQHPGETMAEWWVEGFLERMLDPEDPVSRALLERAVVYVVPSMNPDGGVRGHLRCNARGVNLNRAWKEPDVEDSPEVYFVRRRMHETGVDFFLDVHGDEALPYNFIAGGDTYFDSISGLRSTCNCAETSLTGQLFGPDGTGEFGGALVAEFVIDVEQHRLAAFFDHPLRVGEAKARCAARNDGFSF